MTLVFYVFLLLCVRLMFKDCLYETRLHVVFTLIMLKNKCWLSVTKIVLFNVIYKIFQYGRHHKTLKVTSLLQRMFILCRSCLLPSSFYIW